MNSTKIGFVNFGGGTGKTTSAYWTSRYLANKDISTLVIDTDAQGCITARLLGIPDDGRVEDTLGDATIANALEYGTPLCELAKRSIFSDLVHVVGADKYLVSAMGRMQPKSGNNLFLRKAIKRERELECKAILIDSAPDADMMIENVLYACDYIVIPATPEAKSVRGILTVMEMVKIVRANRLEDSDGADDGPTISGVIVCDVGRSAGHREYVNKLKEISAAIADTNGTGEDCYIKDENGNPERGILGVIPRYEGKKASTDLWLSYVPTVANIVCSTDL